MTDDGKKFARFVEIVRKLRADNGCPWDREQIPASLTRYLREETGEAIEAIDTGNPGHIRDELGDILYLIVLLSRIYEEEGAFSIGDVVDSVTEKMLRRHPHVFGNEKIDTVAELRTRWQEIKRTEKSGDNDRKKN